MFVPYQTYHGSLDKHIYGSFTSVPLGLLEQEQNSNTDIACSGEVNLYYIYGK